MRGAGDITITSQMGSGVILLHHSKLGQLGTKKKQTAGGGKRHSQPAVLPCR